MIVRSFVILALVASATLPQVEAGGGGPTTALSAPSFVNEGRVDAPIGEVWKIWSTPEGWRVLGVAKVDLDFRPGGLIRSHYSPDGTLGDPGTIQNRIMAYEPPRMLAMRIDRPPEKFPFADAWKHTWTVISLTDLGDGSTWMRIASMGFGDDEESQAMRRFFEQGNEITLRHVQAHFGAAPQAGAGIQMEQNRTPKPATPSDFDFLEGRWDIVYKSRAPGVPPDVRGTWICSRQADGRVLYDEFRLFGPGDRTVALGLTYRIFDELNQRWDMRYVAVISPGPDGSPRESADWAELTAWREGSTIRVDQHGQRSELRITYFDIDLDHFRWKADVSTDGGTTWRTDQIQIEATRAR